MRDNQSNYSMFPSHPDAVRNSWKTISRHVGINCSNDKRAGPLISILIQHNTRRYSSLLRQCKSPTHPLSCLLRLCEANGFERNADCHSSSGARLHFTKRQMQMSKSKSAQKCFEKIVTARPGEPQSRALGTAARRWQEREFQSSKRQCAGLSTRAPRLSA